MLRILSFLYLLLLFSCQNENPASYTVKTPQSINKYEAEVQPLKGSNFGPRGQFGLLTDVLLIGDRLIVKDDKSQHLFHAVSNKDFFSFQDVGEGPGKVQNPSFVKIVGYNQAEQKVNFFSYASKKIRGITVSKDSTSRDVYSIPGDYWGGVQSAVPIDDSTVIMTGLFSDAKFYLTNPNQDVPVVKSVNENPFAGQFSEKELLEMAPRDMAVNKSHSLVALLNSGINSIYIYKANGKPHKYFSFGSLENLTPEGRFSREYFYYYGMKTKGDLVYALYLGEKNSSIAFQETFLLGLRPELHIYNLVTDELARYRMDRMVNVCEIDENKNVIYCIEEDNEEQPLVKYELH